MTQYYKKINVNGDIKMLLTYDFEPVLNDPLMVEISEAEYNQLLEELTADNEESLPEDEISDSEALAIITGGEDA